MSNKPIHVAWLVQRKEVAQEPRYLAAWGASRFTSNPHEAQRFTTRASATTRIKDMHDGEQLAVVEYGFEP